LFVKKIALKVISDQAIHKTVYSSRF